MEFASSSFIWVFLPLCLVFYGVCFIMKDRSVRTKAQNLILLFFSLLFYLWSGVYAFLFYICFILLNYGAGIWIDCFSGDEPVFYKSRKGVFLAAIISNIAILCFFKYTNILWSFAQALTAPHIGLKGFILDLMMVDGKSSATNILIPLALSFIVFQAISYLTDVYNKTIRAEKNILSFSLFMSFFAQLTQGPIMRFAILGKQIQDRSPSFVLFSEGVKRFCYGLGKKVIIANTIAATSDIIWNSDITRLSTAEAWFGVLLFTIQIYYDFSGYSDMAVGIGKMFGFSLSENFNYPYMSVSVQDFWRRWHMTLSSWFRDYIYIPLGGNRKGLKRTLLNLMLVFLITGIWHGANLTFIVWGLWFACLSIAERLFLGKWLKKNPIKILNWAYTIAAVSLGWVFFRAQNLYHAYRYFGALFGMVSSTTGKSIASLFSADLLFAIILGALFSGGIQRLLTPAYLKMKNSVVVSFAETIIPLAIFCWSLLLIVAGSYSPSIYAAF